MSRIARLAAAPARLTMLRPGPNHAGRNVSAFAARVDASFSKTKLTRMHKIELQAACEELGLDTEGTKQTLIAGIQAHFASEAPADKQVGTDIKSHTIIMNQSAAKTKPRAEAPAVTQAIEEAPPAATKSEDLAARVRALDNTIQERTAQLQELRNTDKRTVEGLLVDHKTLKQHFERNLEALSSAMDDVVELQGSYGKLAAMQGEQAELKEMVEALSRLLQQREREVDRLSAQLGEMRSKQAQESKERTSERIAMLALTATQMNTAVVGGDASTASVSAGATTLEPPASNQAVTNLNAAMAMPAAIRAGGQAIPADAASDVFGPALPGLVVCDAGRKAIAAYAAMRDVFCHKAHERAAANVATTAAMIVTLLVAGSS